MIGPVSSKFTRDDGSQFFNCAYLARVPAQLAEESFTSPVADWNATISEARHSVGKLLAPQSGVSYAFEPENHVTLFNNTTSAFARVLSRIERAYAGSDPILLTTDLEYPGCVAAIDDSWSGPVVMTRVMTALLESNDPDQVLHDAIVRSHNFVKPRVVFASHVMRATGQVLSPKTLRSLRELNPRVILVLDGSQAIGNVMISRELLDEVDFYIASGHKWLGGLTTTGFVWSRDPERWRSVADPAQAFAYPGQLGGSGNAAAWSSLIGSVEDMAQERPKTRLERIAQHNRSLGRVFSEALAPADKQIHFVTPRKRKTPPSGLVTVGITPRRGDRLEKALKAAGFLFTVLDSETVYWRSRARNRFLLQRNSEGQPEIIEAGPETSTSPKKARTDLRFCFHYWHSEEDVRALANEILAKLPKRRRRALRKKARS